MQKKLRVAMIGAGQRARQVIYPALSGMRDVDIEAMCDIDPERRAVAARDFAIPKTYGDSVLDYRRMIQDICPDAVFSIGQPHILYDTWMWLLERRIPLYIEKPMGITMHQARSLAYLAQENDVPTQVSFQRRYAPVAAQALAMCRERGPITHALCRFYKCETQPFLGARDHMMDDTVHSIDTLRWIVGDEIDRTESVTRRVGTPDINFISAVLHFKGGAVGHLINSWSSGKRMFSVEMHAPGIFAEVEHEIGARVYRDNDLTGIALDAKEAAQSESFAVYTGVSAAIEDFFRSIRSGGRAMSHFGDAVHTMEAAETILAQAMLSDRA